ncbi:MAG: metallophosphoesterase [Phycisphaerae bacterium]
MRICFTSDLHGRVALYDHLERLVSAEKPDLLILGGDLFPDGSGVDPAASQAAYIEDVFAARLRAWRSAAPQMTIACISGNHDWRYSKRVLSRLNESGLMVLLGDSAWSAGGLQFFGYSRTPPTPHWVKDFEGLDLPGDPLPQTGGSIWDEGAGRIREVSAEEHFKRPEAIAVDLQLYPRAAAPWVFVCHAPPYASKLDRLPHIEAPIGSRAVRKFIESRAPLLSLHGHFHESPSVTGAFHDWVGKTLSINPGQTDERLCAVLLDSTRLAESMRHTVYA